MTPTRQDSSLKFDQSGFRYPQISTERNEIRILTLYPGKYADDIRCRLRAQSLDDRPLFHALSYSWGHHNDRSSIYVDWQTFNVSPSLEAALKQIRQEDEPLSLWVDKLCINQWNEAEKSQQVGLMHRIYQQCSNALIWLGPVEVPVQSAKKHELLRRYSTRSTLAESVVGGAVQTVLSAVSKCFCCIQKPHAYEALEQDDEYLEDPFDMIMHFAADRHISELPCFLRSRFWDKKLYFRETKRFRAMWIRFKQLLETSWHSRFWCVQEALLPNNAWVMYGSWRIPLATIKKSLQNQRRHLHTCCSQVEKLFPTTYAFCPDSLYFAPAPTHDLDLLLRMYRYKDCRNPRDKVYGILALFDEAPALNVNYTQTVSQVYTNAMSLIVNNAQGELRCLTGQGFSSSRHDLPSWVRDLQQRPGISSVQFEMRRMNAYNLYNSSEGLVGSGLTQAEDTLTMYGQYIDMIEIVCLPLDVPVEHIDWRYAFQVLLSWRRAAGDKLSTLLRPNVTTQAFWRCLLADTIWSPGDNFRRFTGSDIKPYEYWLKQALIDWLTFRKPKIEDKYVQALLAACFGRAMFVTKSGRIGLCYANARTGDQIWTLNGGNVPFILRQHEDEERGHALVCDGYLHGFMDGEATEDENERLIMIA